MSTSPWGGMYLPPLPTYTRGPRKPRPVYALGPTPIKAAFFVARPERPRVRFIDATSVADAAREIQRITAEAFDVPLSAMTSERRAREWSWPRQIAMDLTRKHLPEISLPRIGRLFGGKHHTTVMHAVRSAAKRLKSRHIKDAFFASKYHEAERRVKAALALRQA